MVSAYFNWKSQKSIFVNVNSVFKELLMIVQLSNRLLLPFSIVLIIIRDLKAVTGVICNAHFATNDWKGDNMAHVVDPFRNLVLF